MEIRIDDLCSPEIRALLEEHRRSLFLHSPPDSVHALELDGLLMPEIAFFTAWEGAALLGCGALKELPGRCGEVKSMRTAAAHLRKGVARQVLAHIVSLVQSRNDTSLFLETGIAEAFAPARRMYAEAGFLECTPFGDYQPDPFSTFMRLNLE
jgi:putative acetyltransferase